VRRAFRHATLLCIAHRLATIMDCDRVLVMEQGRAKELDTPARLLAQPHR
jgi:ABC-type multidrug transport system fused ATPase/permease subunit